ncbi:angel [Carabus blaptoides fortunei]
MNIPLKYRLLITGVLVAVAAVLYQITYAEVDAFPLLQGDPETETAQATRKVLYNTRSIAQRSYSDFVAHSLRKVYLFRDEKHGQGQQDGGSHRHSSTNSGDTNKVLQDKEIVRTLRNWMPAQITASTSKQNNSLEFTLMSYNVLAQDLLTGHAYLYRNHSPNALLWETRWANLFEEIVTHNADIICLQEVQESHVGKYYSQLNSLGYANVYKRKTGNKTDGCAIYYKKSMFKMIENTTVEYNQGYSVLDRDNVAIVVKLTPVKHPRVEFVVATTHLLYNPRRQDVRLAQTQVLLAEIDRIAYKPGNPNNYIPVIVTGDFNSEPESAVYKLLVDGTLRYDNLTHRTLIPTNTNFGLAGKILIPDSLRITDSCQHLNLMQYRSLNATLPRGEELKLIHLRHSKRPKISLTDREINDALFSTGTLSHELKLQSAFIHNVGNDTVGTTNQDGWITVDYIFYSGEYSVRKQQIVDGKLKLLSRYSIPTTQQLLKVQNIPNFALGSDHLALLTKFRLEF